MNRLGISALCLTLLVATASAGVTISATAPSTNVLSDVTGGGTNTGLFPLTGSAPSPISGNDNHARGQLFSLPDGSGAGYEITAITFQKNNAATFNNDSLTLRIFEGTQAQWTTGTGHSSGTNFYSGTTVIPLHTEVFNLNGIIGDNQYITLELATPITVNENSNFGFFLTYDPSSGTSPDRIEHLERPSGGGRISISTSGHGVSTSRAMNCYIQGAPTASVGPLINLASPFQDRMVLQRDKPVKVWGTSDPSITISVSINGTTANGTADAQGNWEALLPALAASSTSAPLVITSGSTTKTINDVLVGDVWFCFGQSNMVRTLSEMNGSAAYITAINNNDNIRCLQITQDGSLTEEDSADMSWLANSTASTWTSVGSVFAHQLHTATNVPVAIIWAAWGSSSIEGWTPLELAADIPHFADMLTLYQSISEYASGATTSTRLPAAYSTNEEGIAGLTANGWSSESDDIFMRTRPNIIYNKMVHPMLNYGISGFIWYQGEANAINITNSGRYGYSLPRFVTEYRERFDQGDIPFLGVQLPSHNQSNWPWFREAQNQLETLNNAHVAVTIDTGSAGNIHPTDKEPIGIRLALLARRHALGESIEASGPRFSSMAINGNQVTLSFTNATGLTTDNAQSPTEFEIAGADQVFHAATSASISNNQVIISSSSVATPVAVRYAWRPSPVNSVNLVNSSGLPAGPFRTDTWTYSTWANDFVWNPGDDESQTGDPDKDGIINFLEYALGSDPLTPDRSGLPTLTQNGSNYDFKFNNVHAGVRYEVLISNDLINWSDPAFATLNSASSTPVSIPASNAVGGKLFIRLKVEE